MCVSTSHNLYSSRNYSRAENRTASQLGLIQDCKDNQELVSYLGRNLDKFSIKEITSFFQQLSKLNKHPHFEPVPWNKTEVAIFHRLFAKISSLIPKLDVRAICNIIYGLSRTRHYERQLVEDLLARAYELESDFRADDIGFLLFGLRVMHKKDPAVTDHYMRLALEQKNFLSAYHLSIILELMFQWRCGELSDAEEFLKAAKGKSLEATPIYLLNYVVGASHFVGRPGAEHFLDKYVSGWCALLEPHLSKFSCIDLGKLGIGLAHMRYFSPSFIDHYLNACKNAISLLMQKKGRHVGRIVQSLSLFYMVYKQHGTDPTVCQRIEDIIKSILDVLIHKEFAPYTQSKMIIHLGMIGMHYEPFFTWLETVWSNNTLIFPALLNMVHAYSLLGINKQNRREQFVRRFEILLEHNPSRELIEQDRNLRTQHASPYKLAESRINSLFRCLESLAALDIYSAPILNNIITMTKTHINEFESDDVQKLVDRLKCFRTYDPSLNEEIKEIKKLFATAHLKPAQKKPAVIHIHPACAKKTKESRMLESLASLHIVNQEGLLLKRVPGEMPALQESNWNYLVQLLQITLNEEGKTLEELLNELLEKYPTSLMDVDLIGGQISNILGLDNFEYYRTLLKLLTDHPEEIDALDFSEFTPRECDTDIRFTAIPSLGLKERFDITKIAETSFGKQCKVEHIYPQNELSKSRIGRNNNITIVKSPKVDLVLVMELARKYLYECFRIPLKETLLYLKNVRLLSTTHLDGTKALPRFDEAPRVHVAGLGKGDPQQHLVHSLLKKRIIEEINSVDQYGWAMWLVGHVKGIEWRENENSSLVSNMLSQFQQLPEDVLPQKIISLIEQAAKHLSGSFHARLSTAIGGCCSLRRAGYSELAENVWRLFLERNETPSLTDFPLNSPWLKEMLADGSPFSAVEAALYTQAFLWMSHPRKEGSPEAILYSSDSSPCLSIKTQHQGINYSIPLSGGIEDALDILQNRSFIQPFDLSENVLENSLGDLPLAATARLFSKAETLFLQQPSLHTLQVMKSCYAMDRKKKYLWKVLAYALKLVPALVSGEQRQALSSLLSSLVGSNIVISQTCSEAEIADNLWAILAKAPFTELRNLPLKLWSKDPHILNTKTLPLKTLKELVHTHYNSAFEFYRTIRHSALFSVRERALVASLLFSAAPQEIRLHQKNYVDAELALLPPEQYPNLLCELYPLAQTETQLALMRSLTEKLSIKQPEEEKQVLLAQLCARSLLANPSCTLIEEDYRSLCNFVKDLSTWRHLGSSLIAWECSVIQNHNLSGLHAAIHAQVADRSKAQMSSYIQLQHNLHEGFAHIKSLQGYLKPYIYCCAMGALASKALEKRNSAILYDSLEELIKSPKVLKEWLKKHPNFFNRLIPGNAQPLLFSETQMQTLLHSLSDIGVLTEEQCEIYQERVRKPIELTNTEDSAAFQLEAQTIDDTQGNFLELNGAPMPRTSWWAWPASVIRYWVSGW